MATLDNSRLDPIDDCIQSVRQSEEREASERLWELRADEIRKREMFVNLAAITKAVRVKFDRLQAGLPERQLEFIENPARYFTLRHVAIAGMTVNVGMSLDGALLTIETTQHISPNEILPTILDTARVEVEGNSTYYLHHDNPVTASDIADIILRPLLESLRKRRR